MYHLIEVSGSPHDNYVVHILDDMDVSLLLVAS